MPQALRSSRWLRPSSATRAHCSAKSGEISSEKPDRVHMVRSSRSGRDGGTSIQPPARRARPVVAVCCSSPAPTGRLTGWRDEADPPGGSARPRSTIYDVARAAGVATSTVSRALSHPGRVSFATAERVRQVAEEVGYRSDRIQRAPVRRTSLLAVVVADITNPVFFGMVRGAERTAAHAGYTTLVVETQESETAERAALDRVQPAVDGVVLTSSRMADASIREVAKQRTAGGAQPDGGAGAVGGQRQRPGGEACHRAPRGGGGRRHHLPARARGLVGRRDAVARAAGGGDGPRPEGPPGGVRASPPSAAARRRPSSGSSTGRPA